MVNFPIFGLVHTQHFFTEKSFESISITMFTHMALTRSKVPLTKSVTLTLSVNKALKYNLDNNTTYITLRSFISSLVLSELVF